MPKIIAIIDDEVEMEYIYNMLLEDVIESREVDVRFFSDSRLFEQWLRHNNPDLILSDISMPFISGAELGHRIRQSGKNICTYFVSGHDEHDYQQTMKELGISRYIAKPLNLNKMMEFIKTDLGLTG